MARGKNTREKAVEGTHPGVRTKELQQQYQARDPTKDGSIALSQVVQGEQGEEAEDWVWQGKSKLDKHKTLGPFLAFPPYSNT